MRKILCVIYFISLNASVSDEKIRTWLDSYKGFEENFGQIRDFEGNPVEEILFFTKNDRIGIFIGQKGVSYVIYNLEKTSIENEVAGMPFQAPENVLIHFARIDIELINSNIDKSKVIYEEELPGYTNYYLAHCPEGILFVKSYKKIRIKDVYPGIDWIWKYEGNYLHHEFEIKPYADINKIRMKIKYCDYEIKENGKKVVFQTPIGSIEDGKISAYENKKYVDVSYKTDENGVIYFDVKNYSKKNTLLIDPPLSLLWATYYGGNTLDYAHSISSDPFGNIFLTGYTYSTNFPTYYPGGGAYYEDTNQGECDLFILKFDNSGVRKWATYYGGTDWDYGYSITTDGSGNIFITGYTISRNFPLRDPGGGAYFQQHAGSFDVFILKFNNLGLRKWATYYGGRSYDQAYCITADSFGNIFLTGRTASVNFPLYNPGGGAYYQWTIGGNYDAFILKFDTSGVIKWGTYYGGIDWDEGWCIKADKMGNVFVTGRTYSLNFPTHNPGGGAYYQGINMGGHDLFILKFNNSGVRKWATYYGGEDWDWGISITIDAMDNLFITGNTNSIYFPTYDPGGGAYYQGTLAKGPDLFILKFDNSGIRKWATYYGGDNFDECYSITHDLMNNIFLTGYTKSINFPVYNPGGGAYYQEYKGGIDVFILKFDNTGIRKWATYYGGDTLDIGYSITTDTSGNIFLTGYTFSNDLPTYNPGGGTYYQGVIAGGYDLFILKFESSINIREDNELFLPRLKFLNIPTFFEENIELKINGLLEKGIKISVYNSSGRIVYSKEFSHAHSLLLSGEKLLKLGKGIYFILVYSEKQEIGKTKLIKK